MIKQLESLGYLPASAEAREQLGLTPAKTYDEIKLAKGIDFVVSSHGREAHFMDSDGRILHRWSHRAFRPQERKRTKKILETWYIRKAHLLPSGELLAVLGPGAAGRRLCGHRYLSRLTPYDRVREWQHHALQQQGFRGRVLRRA
jgi:hypothetical protein